jgi:hypothetical protein
MFRYAQISFMKVKISSKLQWLVIPSIFNENWTSELFITCLVIKNGAELAGWGQRIKILAKLAEYLSLYFNKLSVDEI